LCANRRHNCRCRQTGSKYKAKFHTG
jgi:hypothetical protein